MLRALYFPLAKRALDKFEKINNTIFMISVILTSIIWGLGFAQFMIQDGEHSAKLLMEIGTAGLCAGGAVTFIPHLKLSIVYTLFMLLPAGLLMMITGNNTSHALAILLFIIYLCFMAYRGTGKPWNEHCHDYL